MKRPFGILIVCLLAFTLGFAQDAPERTLPQIQQTQCSNAANVIAKAAFDAAVADLEEVGMTIERSQGGCGTWDLSPDQRENLGELLLKDLRSDEDNGECMLMNSSDEDKPFGLTATVGCKQDFPLEDGTVVHAGMVISVLVDAGNDTIIFFLLASK